ncbi:MAG: hypothetical protein QNJ94_17670 [Alphaproteobacteria bacterium]|nr:hypothetical protein [Alphaproteobacteria bacterium]
MDAVLAALEGTAIAQTLRASRWGYAAVNAAHILGIALLVGAIIPLHLRFLGAWRSVSRPVLVRVLVPIAATGLGLAVVAGLLLFSVRAREYASIGFLQAKFVLVAVGALSALALHRAHGFLLESASESRLAGHAIVACVCWIGALVCGRLIAFAGD